MWRLENGRLLPYLHTEFRLRVGPDYPRQKLDPIYVNSAVVDAVWTRVIEEGSTTGNTVIPYFTEPMLSITLDSLDDFVMAELVIRSISSGRQGAVEYTHLQDFMRT